MAFGRATSTTLSACGKIWTIESSGEISKRKAWSTGKSRRRLRESRNLHQICGRTPDCRAIGVHILRHSAASRMLNSGVPMKQIADILRHRSIDTSMIYAKVDLQRLAAVAMPWPGGAA
ncbi:tyrosine-type recombinase/integrase [Mesorhizobium sp. M0772]|uniref:tyrosine-type recombinase/integrase n=1 Tax=Mesorhizobium sp. M0772 TaxID=2956998 RepID=UPI003337F00B